MEARPALARAAHLIDYMAILRDIGAPVDRELAKSQLPLNIEETPDLYVSLPLALEWIARTGHDLQPMEIGLLAARRASISLLRPTFQTAIMTAPTVLTRLQAVATHCRLEDSILEMTLRQEAENIRVICNMVGMACHPYASIGEWQDLHAVISIIRSVMGPSWNPVELCFVASCRPPEAAHLAFPDSRILVGQPQTSILMKRKDLIGVTFGATFPANGVSVPSKSVDELNDQSADWEFVDLMRMLIQPYVSEGSPDIAFAAELAGLSKRTLQRRLSQCGSTYSRVLQEARFQLACTRLGDPHLKVIDIAMMTGYEGPQHFSRAFRRFTGLSPSEYRKCELGSGAG